MMRHMVRAIRGVGSQWDTRTERGHNEEYTGFFAAGQDHDLTARGPVEWLTHARGVAMEGLSGSATASDHVRVAAPAAAGRRTGRDEGPTSALQRVARMVEEVCGHRGLFVRDEAPVRELRRREDRGEDTGRAATPLFRGVFVRRSHGFVNLDSMSRETDVPVMAIIGHELMHVTCRLRPTFLRMAGRMGRRNNGAVLRRCNLREMRLC